MKNYRNEILLGSLLLVLFGGAIFWFARHEPEAILKIIIAGFAIFLGVVTFVWRLIQTKRNLAVGAPAEDEFTELAKLHAGSKAFLYSLYLWFLIFIFHTSFPNQEEMLGIGILGSAGIYGICLWYYKSTSDFANEK
jgi:hypothetical protein